ncbi:MAG TPA: hypothetical protein VGR61_09910, partial [Candidatus Dormibacteraeota bacterium]|nr:hypothetical protein [Candidatus Dormibacteraeota bacterium]
MIDATLLAEIVAGVDQGYVLVDGAGMVTALGNRAATLLGVIEPASAVGEPAATLIHTIGQEIAVFDGEGSALARCLATGEEWRGPLSGINV